MQNSSGKYRSGNRFRLLPMVIAGVLALLILVACGSGAKNAPQGIAMHCSVPVTQKVASKPHRPLHQTEHGTPIHCTCVDTDCRV